VKIAFVHFSDLFYPSGSAVLYRRILAEVAKEHDVSHVIGPNRSRPETTNILEAYARELPGIRPIFLPLSSAYRLYRALSGRTPFRQWKTLPGILLRPGLKRFLAQQCPDFIWWSSDYMPDSFSALWAMRTILPRSAVLHLSILDPPEFWTGQEPFPLYARCLTMADSFDCIGSNLLDRLRQETGKPVFIINDFINSIPDPGVKQHLPDEPLRVALTGMIYGRPELQDLLNLLGQATGAAELLWFGEAGRYEGMLHQLQAPPNVTIRFPGSIPRAEMSSALAPCALGYLSMPLASPEFARYSLPTKLATYVEAGLPVAFHAPADSEVQILNQQHGFGVNLALAEAPVDALGGLVRDAEFYRAGLRRLGAARFAKERVLATVGELLACTPQRLRKTHG
jgi:hypothetical protein